MPTILNVFPEHLDLNGDAQNATVLARRARWAGLDVDVRALAVGDRPGGVTPALVVVGSGAESSMPTVLEGLRSIESELTAWFEAGVPILAIGTGWELLSIAVEHREGRQLDGLGLFPGRSIRAARVSDDLVVDTDFGRIVGFESHDRDYVLDDDAHALGTIVSGRGNGGNSRSEGVRVGSSIGTHLHGPVLAKNPAIADEMLRVAFRADYRVGAEAARVDEIARHARLKILATLGLTLEP
jgi:CobQ-like glutamine amidotransferase family enzyme